MASRAQSSIRIEWFNVTYRSVYLVIALVVLAVGGGCGSWYYLRVHKPRTDATGAIDRAEDRLQEASRLGGGRNLDELIEGATSSLGEARMFFAASRYHEARERAIRSDNLSLKALRQSGQGIDGNRRVEFVRIEGDVRVKRAGSFSWEPAHPNMDLQIGDQVKTSSSASAQLIYFDGTITTIETGSLLEIRELYEDPVTKVRRVKERLSWGHLKASTQERNVKGSVHEVSTDKAVARAERASEFRVSFDRETKATRIDAFDGTVEVDAGGKRENLVGGEGIRADARGRLSAKQQLPIAPRLEAPRDQRVFIWDNPEQHSITLSWERVPGAETYNLVISDKGLFTEPAYDAIRESTTAVLQGVGPGAYHWKVAAISPAGARGPFSAPRRFRVSSEKILDHSDTEPPVLEITEFVPVGMMVIVNGRTEPGATLWADDEKVDVFDDGTFYAVIRLRKQGLNELSFVAQDTAGNETEVQKTAYLEVY